MHTLVFVYADSGANLPATGKTTLRNTIAMRLRAQLQNDQYSNQQIDVQIHSRDNIIIYQNGGMPGSDTSQESRDSSQHSAEQTISKTPSSDRARDDIYISVLTGILNSRSNDTIALVCGNWEPRLKSKYVQDFLLENKNKFHAVAIKVTVDDLEVKYKRMADRAKNDPDAALRNASYIENKDQYIEECKRSIITDKDKYDSHETVQNAEDGVSDPGLVQFGELTYPYINVRNNTNKIITKMPWHPNDKDNQQIEVFAPTPEVNTLLDKICDFIQRSRTSAALLAEAPPKSNRKRTNSEATPDATTLIKQAPRSNPYRSQSAPLIMSSIYPSDDEHNKRQKKNSFDSQNNDTESLTTEESPPTSPKDNRVGFLPFKPSMQNDIDIFANTTPPLVFHPNSPRELLRRSQLNTTIANTSPQNGRGASTQQLASTVGSPRNNVIGNTSQQLRSGASTPHIVSTVSSPRNNMVGNTSPQIRSGDSTPHIASTVSSPRNKLLKVPSSHSINVPVG